MLILVITLFSAIKLKLTNSTRISASLNSNTNSASAHITDKFLQTNVNDSEEIETTNEQIRNFVDSVKNYGTYEDSRNNMFGTKMLSSTNYIVGNSVSSNFKNSNNKKVTKKSKPNKTKINKKVDSDKNDELDKILEIPSMIELHKKGETESSENHVTHWVTAIQAIRHFKTRLSGYKPKCEKNSRYYFRFGCNNPYSNL